MDSYARIIQALSRWIDLVAMTVLGGLERLRASRHVGLAEHEDGTFALAGTDPHDAVDGSGTGFRIGGGNLDDATEARIAPLINGARVDLLLQPDRFVFRPLALPSRAGEFLEGIIRAQIDRLTPWSPTDAVFGWSPPVEAGGGRMAVMVAATGRGLVMPLVQALSGLGAASIRLRVVAQEPDAAPIQILELKTRAAREIYHTRRILGGVLAGLGMIAAASTLASIVIGADLEARQTEMARRIVEIRAALQLQHDPSSEPVRALQQRKRDAPSSVVVVEALARSLPDHTYLTELRVQDGKIQIIGITRDAPSLIRLLEQAPQFSEASFFAPTTRSLVKPGENFHIEAKIRPNPAPSP